MDAGLLLLLVGALLAATVVVALGASRIGFPLLVAFLVLGMLLGSDGPGGIEFDDADLARVVGTVGLVAILFGGLSTSWRRLRQRGGSRRDPQHVIGLVVGVVLGAGATWAFARIPQSIGAFAPVASIAAAALSFGVSDQLGGSGFLSV